MRRGPIVDKEKERDNNGNTISYNANGNATQNGYRVFLRDALLADWLINRSVGSKQLKPHSHLSVRVGSNC